MSISWFPYKGTELARIEAAKGSGDMATTGTDQYTSTVRLVLPEEEYLP